jgi:phosphate transport system protein
MPESLSPSLSPHTSSGYDEKLAQAHTLVLQMAERARRQVDDAIECLRTGSAALADQVLRHELTINALERSIDALVEQIIARRQPAASDLRLLTTIFKVTTDLERIGDEAKKVALQARKIHADSIRMFPATRGSSACARWQDRCCAMRSTSWSVSTPRARTPWCGAMPT